MKKAPALITLAIIASTVALTFYLSLRSEKQSLDAWQLVAANTIAVFETNKPEAFNKLKTDTSRLLKYIASVAGSRNFNDPYLFCFQSLGKELGWVAILPKQFPGLLDTLSQLRMQIKNRSYEGKTLYDVYDGKTPWASLVQIDGIWSVSRHAILVEAIVRQGQSRDRNFKRQHHRLFALPTVKQDDGNLFLGNTAILTNNESDVLLPLSHSLVLDLRWTEQTLMANGFSTDTTNQPTLLSLFGNQQPVSLDLRKALPDDLQSAVHFGFSNAKAWLKKRDDAMKTSGPHEQGETHSDGFDSDAFASAVDNEMVFCRFDEGTEIVLVELKEITKAQTQLEKIRTAASKAGQYARQNYANRTIHTLKRQNALSPLVWPFRLRSDETSYAFDGNLLLIAPAAKTIEAFISLTDAERTTGKSISWQRFLETTLVEANVSFLTNLPPADFSMSAIGLPMLAPVEKSSFQFYSLEGNHYASGSILFLNQAVRKKSTNARVMLSGQTLLKPALVRNYLERTNEIIVQDSANNLQLIDGRGLPRWVKAVDGRIATQIGELDYLNNGKVQFLFCTPGKIQLIDRLGKDVAGFPKHIEINEPRWLSVVDYDNTRNYRLMISDDKGNILLTDKNGKSLEGWSPKSLGRPFADAPNFYRISGRDYFLAITVDGEIHLFNRKGEPVSGFPIDTRLIPSGQVFCDGSTIAMVSQDGMLIKFDNHGKKVFEEPLLKNTKEAVFRLATSFDGGGMVVIRSERGTLAAFDSTGKQLFEIVNPLSDKLDVQFVRAGREKELITFRDTEQGLLFAVDMKGRPIMKQPVQATQPPAVDYDREAAMIRMFIVNDDRIDILKVPY